MSGTANTVKIFQFAIEIDGLDQMLVQEVKHPEVERGKVEHGAEDYNVKTAGGKSVSDAELKKLVPAPASDSWAWDWMQKAGNSLAEDYKKDIVVKELAPDGNTTINAWLWEGCWVSKPARSDYKRGNQNENVLETVTIVVDDVKKIA